MAFTKILVAVDPDGKGQTAVFERSLAFAGAGGRRLMLLGCLKPATSAEIEDRVGTMARVDSSASQATRRHFQEGARDHSRVWLESLADEARQRGLEAGVVVEFGKAGPEICRLAERWKADVIVLGMTRRGELADRLLGSVTHHVVHHAPCSVLLVHPS